MDLLTTEQRISQLQMQLSQQMNSVNPTIQQPQKTETVEEMIHRILEEKLSKISSVITNPIITQPVEPEPQLDYGTQLLIAIGSAISEEQQVWLSDVSNQVAIPDFLKSTEGQAITRRFMTVYKQYRTK